MKIKTFAILMLTVGTLCVSCKSDKKQQANNDPLGSKYLRPAGVNYSHDDSVAISSLVSQFMKSFEAKDYLAASRMLYTFKRHDEAPVALTEQQQQDFNKAFSSRNIYAIKSHGFILRDELNNEVSYLLQIVKNGNIDKQQGTTTFSLNPIRYKGQWYLTLLTPYAKGVNLNPYEKDR